MPQYRCNQHKAEDVIVFESEIQEDDEWEFEFTFEPWDEDDDE